MSLPIRQRRRLNGKGITEVNKIALVKRTRGTETSQYLEERTSTETPVVVASEPGDPPRGVEYVAQANMGDGARVGEERLHFPLARSEEHTSELQSLMLISYAVFCLKNKKKKLKTRQHKHTT